MAVKKSAKKAKKPQQKKKAAKKAVKKKPARSASKKAAQKRKMKPSPTARASGKGKPSPKLLTSGKRKEYLQKVLLKKRNEVVQGLEQQLGRKLSFEPGQKIDSAMDNGDLSTMDMNEVVDYSLLEMKYDQYKDIADAFRRLENDTYGLCEECGEEIDIKRLGVNPLARYCIACKTLKEDLERIQKEETRFKE